MRLCKGCHLLVRAVFMVLPLSLHCRGVEIELIPGYSIEVDTYFSVQENQCVTIPCTFTANYQKTFSNSNGYWMKDAWTAVAYNNELKKAFEKRKPNFHFTGDTAEGNCTLTITDARKEDSGVYYFRFEGYRSFSYLKRSVTLNVKDLTDKPEIRQSGLLVAGQEVTLTCIAIGNCPEAFPTILWRKSDLDEIWGVSSNMTFSPKPSDHQTTVTCEVWFSTAKTSVEKTLEVLYPPQEPQIMVSSSNGTIPFMDGVVYIRGNEPLTLNCSADGNPSATVMWTKEAVQDLSWSAITTDSSLKNTYRCLAYNDYGRTEKLLKTIIQDAGLKDSASIDCSTANCKLIVGIIAGKVLQLLIFLCVFCFFKQSLKEKKSDVKNFPGETRNKSEAQEKERTYQELERQTDMVYDTIVMK